MSKRGRREGERPGLLSVPMPRDSLHLSEDVRSGWLWIVGAIGVGLVALAIALNLVWDVNNILPSVALEVGAGTLLFTFLFLLQRRIVRRTSLFWVSALEEVAAQTGQDPGELAQHYSGPVRVVYDVIEAVLDDVDYGRAWDLLDPNLRLCRAQQWISFNATDPRVSEYDREDLAHSLVEASSPHPLWDAFASTELDDFMAAWAQPGRDIRTFGAASRPRPVDDGEIVVLVSLSGHPEAAMALAATRVDSVPILVREIGGIWQVANFVGDRLPEPGWPPDWHEGWTYWDRFS